jgi:hypothetical protein
MCSVGEHSRGCKARTCYLSCCSRTCSISSLLGSQGLQHHVHCITCLLLHSLCKGLRLSQSSKLIP